MFKLNVRLKNAEEVSEFKSILTNWDTKVSTVIGGHVVAKPMITSSPYITPLDDITIHYNSDSINEFMQMIRDFNQFIVEKQDTYTDAMIYQVRNIMRRENTETSQ